MAAPSQRYRPSSGVSGVVLCAFVRVTVGVLPGEEVVDVEEEETEEKEEENKRLNSSVDGLGVVGAESSGEDLESVEVIPFVVEDVVLTSRVPVEISDGDVTYSGVEFADLFDTEIFEMVIKCLYVDVVSGLGVKSSGTRDWGFWIAVNLFEL